MATVHTNKHNNFPLAQRRRFRLSVSRSAQGRSMSCGHDDDVYDHIGERLKLEGETRAMIEERTMGDG